MNILSTNFASQKYFIIFHRLLEHKQSTTTFAALIIRRKVRVFEYVNMINKKNIGYLNNDNLLTFVRRKEKITKKPQEHK